MFEPNLYIYIKYKLLLKKLLNRYADKYNNAWVNLFYFRLAVRLWKHVTESETYVLLRLFLQTGIVQKPSAQGFIFKWKG
jgi:hypothetical protein